MKSNKIVAFCVSAVADEDDLFELLIAYADGREVGQFLSREILESLRLDLNKYLGY